MIINDDFRNHYGRINWANAYVISDPPYNQNYHYIRYKDNLLDDEYAMLLCTAFGNRKAAIVHYPEESINILPRILGECNEVVSWVYPSNTAKQSRLITWWGGAKPDFRKVGQDYKNPTDKRIAKRIEEGKRARLYDWWEINQVKNVSKSDNPHPCPIPYELAERIILTTTTPGDTVIDPFAGSGTVIKAALANGRKAIGFEIDPIYAEYAAANIGELNASKTH